MPLPAPAAPPRPLGASPAGGHQAPGLWLSDLRQPQELHCFLPCPEQSQHSCHQSARSPVVGAAMVSAGSPELGLLQHWQRCEPAAVMSGTQQSPAELAEQGQHSGGSSHSQEMPRPASYLPMVTRGLLAKSQRLRDCGVRHMGGKGWARDGGDNKILRFWGVERQVW